MTPILPFSHWYIDLAIIISTLLITYFFSRSCLKENFILHLGIAFVAAVFAYFIFFCLEFLRKGLALPWNLAIIEAISIIGFSAFYIPVTYKIYIKIKMPPN